MNISTDELADRVAASLQSSLSEFVANQPGKNRLSAIVEVHPCHGVVQFHLTDNLDQSNIDVDSFAFPNIGGCNLPGWSESYLECGILNIDGVSAGGADGDIDVEKRVFAALRNKLKSRIERVGMQLPIDEWLLIVGYSCDGLL